MRKLLLPVDRSERSLKSLNRVKEMFSPEDTTIALVTVVKTAIHFKYDNQYKFALKIGREKLEEYAEMLPGFQVSTAILSGDAGSAIIKYAKDNAFDCVLMTRSPDGSSEKRGSVASYLAKKAPFMDMVILREDVKD